MCVKQHRMKYDELGNLIDDENEQSAEAQFARIFTKYYDTIGEYFPELLRLKELLKLSVLSRIIKARYECQCEFVSRIENDPAIDTYLQEIKQKVDYYLTASDQVDEKLVNTILKILSTQFFCKKSNLKPYIIDWLRYGRQQALSKYIKQSLINQKTKLKFTVEKLHFFYDDSGDDDQIMSRDSSKCSWVPAAFAIDSNMKVYGGIALYGNVKQTSGIKEAQDKSKSITRIDGNKLSANADKQRSKSEFLSVNVHEPVKA